MKRVFWLVVVLVFVALGVEAQDIQKWAIMVEKAELHSEPNVSSPIVGYVKRSEGTVIGDLNKDGSWLHVRKSGSGASGWVMSCVSEDPKNADNPYNFDYETCYKINKEFAEGKISQERFAAMLSNLQNYRDVNDGMSDFEEETPNALQGSWIMSPAPAGIMHMIIAILIVGGVIGVLLQKFLAIRLPILSKLHVILLMLGIFEVLFMIHPYGVSGVDQINALILLVVQSLLIRRVVTRSYRYEAARRYAMISLYCMVAAIIIFICRVGVVEFIGMAIDTVVGTILTLAVVVAIGVLVYGFFTAPSSSDSGNSPNELPEVCKFCKHFDRSSNKCYMDINNPKRKNPNHDTCSRFDLWLISP